MAAQDRGRGRTGTRSGSRSRAPKVLLIIAACLALVVGGTIGWNAFAFRPQGTPEAVELADAEISPALRDATILALGEATHGNAEFQLARLALAEKLPEFRAIMLEEDFGHVALVDEFVQGGPGTAEEAAERFGFRLNHTEQMAELLQGLRDRNDALPEAERVRLVGVDTQRVEASKGILISWLEANAGGEVPAERAQSIAAELADWNDADPVPDPERLRAAVEDAASLIDAGSEDATSADSANTAAPDRRLAAGAAAALAQNLELATASGSGYTQIRARIMAENAVRTVAEEHERGNEHSLFFAHNGHVDRVSAAMSAMGVRDVGELLAEKYGDAYRVIGTDLHKGSLATGDGTGEWEVSLSNRTPLRGIFAGTREGYLEFDSASAANRELLARPVRMASAGDGVQQWQAWVPQFSSVKMTPSEAYDALILVDRVTPTTPLS